MTLPHNYKITHLDSGWIVKEDTGIRRAYTTFKEILENLNLYSQFYEIIIDVKVIREKDTIK